MKMMTKKKRKKEDEKEEACGLSRLDMIEKRLKKLKKNG